MSSILNIRIKEQRLKNKLTLLEVANRLGIKEATMQRYESGVIKNISHDTILKLSQIFGCTPNYLMGWDEESSNIDYLSIPGIMPLPKTVKRPRLGQIACGEPIMNEENFDGYDDVPDNIACDFTLICKGDSMINARIHDGDIVYIKQQPTVENGQIAAIMIDGETTLKRVYIDGDRLTIMPENPAYKPHIYIGEELNKIRIIGRATGFTSYLD